MAEQLKEVDAVVIGVGFAGSIIAKEMAASGMDVVGLERGPISRTVPDFQSSNMHDELRFAVRKALMQDTARETYTFRNNSGQRALPIRRLNGFLPGTGVGGAGKHWNGMTWRFHDTDFVIRSHYEERYGKDFIDPNLTVQDWGITYKELEPYYDRFEYLLGVSGQAGNIEGEIQPGGNPFEAPRSRGFPTPPMKETHPAHLFRQAADKLGLHPFPVPSSNLSQSYTNPEGMQLNACVFCGYCERFGCEHFAKSTPQTVILPALLAQKSFELRTGAHVTRIALDSDKKRATGVYYTDSTGREYFQPAGLVVTTMFALNNVRMLLLSGVGTPYDPETGQGNVGRNYTYQTDSGVKVFYDESVNINPFMGSGASGTALTDYAGDNFDHSKLGFIGGSALWANMTNGRPIGFHPTPPGTPRWGKHWKQAVVRHYNHTVSLGAQGSSMPTAANHLDLDPLYRDAWGQPLLRMTFDFPDNDIRMAQFATKKLREIGEHMGGRQVSAIAASQPYDSTVYQSTHNTGGAIMGADPATSVLNRYQQSWDVPNVFVVGASAYPHNPDFNPTGTVGALAYLAADAIINRYAKNPGPLV